MIFLTRGTWEAHRERTKVVVMPFGPVFNRPGDGSLIASRNILFVASIGNVIADESRPFDKDGFVRNWYTPGWCRDRESVERLTGGGNFYCDLLNDEQLARIFKNLREAQGKALYATWVIRISTPSTWFHQKNRQERLTCPPSMSSRMQLSMGRGWAGHLSTC